MTPPATVAFVCVENAGRSQMAAALAERGLEGRLTVVSGGTEPADAVHDLVVTMGCAAEDVLPATWRGDARGWGLDGPAGRPLDEVREIRDEIARRIEDLVDEGVA